MIAIVISKWLLALNSGKKIGLYLSDISGAFDRVCTELMLQKAARTGLSPSWLKFLKSYFAPRQAVVVVEGVESDPFIIKDMVFQRTNLGPMLWNVFFL